MCLLKNFPEIIKEKRLKLNLNQKELAARCNLSPVSIGKFESELKYPSRRQYALLKEVIK
ncbi:helix-turn-helix transcriptional regulator [Clostridium saudiense]|nr:helix-turn-helix transcriptional regulator [Clostridium saudiense]